MEAFIAFLKAVPALLAIFDKLAALYVQLRIGQMEKAIEEGIISAVKNRDQRELENAIGSPTAGQPSGISGPVIRDSIPCVELHKPKTDQSVNLVE